MSDQEVPRIKAQARVLIDAGRFAEAATMLTHGLAAEPRDYELLCLLSQALISARRHHEAARFAEQAIAVQPDGSWGHRLRSAALRTSQRKESLRSAERAVQCDPHEPFSWHALGRAQLEKGDFKGARSAAEQMRTLAPESFWSHQLLALVALKQKRYDEAEQHCRRELELNPNSYYGLNNLGVALLNKRRTREAVKVFNLAAKMNPSEELARRNLGIAAKKYLPGVGILFVAACGLMQFLRMNGVETGADVWVPTACIVAVIALFYFFWRYRFEQMPAETQNYLKSLRRSATIGRLRDLLLLTAIVCGSLFVLFSFVAFALWGDGDWQQRLIAFMVDTGFLTGTVASAYALRRLEKVR
jgi:tetratricopeptide (TPR) repeat protein